MLLIKNIKQLVQVERKPVEVKRGNEMSELPTIDNAWLLVQKNRIADFGEMDTVPEVDAKVIDAEGKMVLPAWCDSHTHLVFAKTREEEFVDRIKGLSYEEIAVKGGGILNSATKLNETSEDELFESALGRLGDIQRMGTGAVEIKSGYGLSYEGELKMLRVIQRLKAASPVTIKATFLGAHAFPAEYKQDRVGYIRLLTERLLPEIAEQGLADYIDAFCERNYFTAAELDYILEAGAKFGLRPKVHVNQFSSQGGIPVSVKHHALSVDHLEVMEPEDYEALETGSTICTLLPSCSFFLNIPYAPARQLIERGLPVALATDYNPGSTPSGNIPFVLSLACIKMKMLPAEAITAVTINGAAAMEVQNDLGTITKGKKANLVITKKVPSLAYLPYSFGEEWVEEVVVDGKIKI